MLYRAYDISDNVFSRPELTNEQTSNIDSVVKAILKNLPTNKIFYKVPDSRISDKEHPVIQYNNIFTEENASDNDINKELDFLAEKLLYEEQVEEKDGPRRRNKKIKEGLLFAKHTSEQLILLKFEDIQIIDRTTFKPIEGLSIDKQYYKIVILKKDEFNKITVVDKNKKIAKYWASGFLELERQRDSYVNTSSLISLLEADKLINSKIGFSDEEYKEVKGQIKNFIFDNSLFDGDEIFSSLNYNSKKHIINSENLFSKEVFDLIDAEFNLDKDAINEKYRRTIRVSGDIKVTVENLYKELRRGLIEVKGNKLILTIGADSKEKVKKIIDESRNG